MANKRAILAFLVPACILMWLPGTFGDSIHQEDLDKIIKQLQEEIGTLKDKSQYYEEKIQDTADANARLEEMFRDQAAQLEDAAASSGGAVFTWWGRSVCGLQDKNRLYSGIMARSPQAGAGVDFQCLPHNPEYANFMDGDQSVTPGRGILRGVEYQGNPDELFDEDNIPGTTFVNNDAPCTVCELTNRTQTLMIPAMTSCPFGWTLEYWGYLVTSLYSAVGASTHICMDHAPEIVNGAGDDHNSADIYHVEILCGATVSLPCPNYVHGHELACVVCSK